jgi:hypothetical protein
VNARPFSWIDIGMAAAMAFLAGAMVVLMGMYLD